MFSGAYTNTALLSQETGYVNTILELDFDAVDEISGTIDRSSTSLTVPDGFVTFGEYSIDSDYVSLDYEDLDAGSSSLLPQALGIGPEPEQGTEKWQRWRLDRRDARERLKHERLQSE